MIATWITRDLREIPLGALTTPHAIAILLDLRNGAIRRKVCDGLSQGEWILVLEAELLRRTRIYLRDIS